MNHYNFIHNIHTDYNKNNHKHTLIKTRNNTCITANQFIPSTLCKKIIDFGELHNFETIEKEYVKSYRNSKRILIKSKGLADNIWKHLLNLLDVDDFNNVAPRGFGTEGNWIIQSINPMFRISKYEKGGHFSKHSDAGYVLNDNYRSSFSLLIFLNDSFSGGETSIFYGDNKYKIAPDTGKMVIFNHNLEHKGNKVLQGVKYILRTDIMCLRININRGIHSRLYIDNPEYIRAEKLYKKSINYKKLGESSLSTKTFLEAMKIHYSLNMKNVSELSKFSPFRVNLCSAINNTIFSFILDEGYPLFNNLLVISNSWNEMIRGNSYIWYNLYNKTWGRDIKLISNLMNDSRWFEFTRSRQYANNKFKIFGADLGYNKVLFNLIDTKVINKPQESRDEILRRYMFSEMPKNLHTYKYYGEIPAICANTKGHFWGAGSGVNQHAVGYQLNTDPQSNIYNIKNLWYNLHINFNVLQIIIKWIYRNGLKDKYKSEEHPLLLSVPFFINDKAKKIISKMIFKSDKLTMNNINNWDAYKYVSDINAPFLKFISREKLPLLTKGIYNGIVILLDSECSTIVTIEDFNVIDNFSYHILDKGYDLLKAIIGLLNEILQNTDLSENIYYLAHHDINIFNENLDILTDNKDLLDSIHILPYNSIIHGLELYTKLPNVREGFIKNN